MGGCRSPSPCPLCALRERDAELVAQVLEPFLARLLEHLSQTDNGGTAGRRSSRLDSVASSAGLPSLKSGWRDAAENPLEIPSQVPVEEARLLSVRVLDTWTKKTDADVHGMYCEDASDPTVNCVVSLRVGKSMERVGSQVLPFAAVQKGETIVLLKYVEKKQHSKQIRTYQTYLFERSRSKRRSLGLSHDLEGVRFADDGFGGKRHKENMPTPPLRGGAARKNDPQMCVTPKGYWDVDLLTQK